jgi:hypothetical protein
MLAEFICDYNFPAYDYICWRMVLTDCSGYSYCAPFVVAFTLIRKRESDMLIVRFTFVIKIANCSVSTD